MQCLSPKSTGFNVFSSNIANAVGEGSGTLTEPHHTPSPEAQQSSHYDLSPSMHLTVSTETIPTTTPTEIPSLRQYSRRATLIAQSKALPTAADEPASLSRDDSQGEDFSTVSGLEAGHDKENIIKLYAIPHDSTPRQSEMASKISAQDLEISNLKAQIKLLKDKYKGTAELSRDDAPIKGRSLETGEKAGVEKSTERGKSDTSKKKKLQEQIDVQMAREMEEQMARSDQRMDEQIARDTEIARIHAEEALQMLIDGLDRNNKVIEKHLQEYEQSQAELTNREKIELINELVKYQYHHAKILKSHSGWKTKHFKGMTLEEIREKFILVSKKIEDFVPMSSTEEGKRMKRKGLRLEHESAKKMKTSEGVSKEDLKEMMQLVPVEELYVEALQVKHPIIDWEIHTEGKRDY
nr:hypothetical protein [Tanacetum cinerariifolium]